MAYYRSVDERLTCFQEAAPYSAVYAPKADLALVYGLDDSLPERLKQYQNAGYHCAVMFAISWGGYRDYLDGASDGKAHWDEGQKDRSGRELIHNLDVPYLVPTDVFCDYLIQRLKPAVDAGAEGAVIEEPEFNAAAGYSQAFRRAYEQRYAEPFTPPHENVTAAVRCARLKADLYAKAIRRVAAGVKAYAKARGRQFFITVATHSVINYSQWQIVSPVGQAGLMPEADSLIAQVWTGTSRTAQVYDGRVAERVFETAFMEYASLIAAAGTKPVSLLTDPIEDSLVHSWEMYRKSYIDTLLAALMQPDARRFELCPWPKRVFCGQYPRVQPNIGTEIELGFAAGPSKAIPRDYASLLCGIFELMGNLPEEAGIYENGNAPLGFLLSDSCLYERLTPDTVSCDRSFETEGFKLLTAFRAEKPGAAEACSRLLQTGLEGSSNETARFNAFKESTLSPDFYGLSMPLIKYGLPLKFIFTSHIANGQQLPEELRAAVLSYDFMKPESPAVHDALSKWVREGGYLIYAGAADSAFAKDDDSWWHQKGYSLPEEHLFELLGLCKDLPEGEYPLGKGMLRRVWISPARICLQAERAERWRSIVAETLTKAGYPLQWRNRFTVRRSRYLFCAVMDESGSAEPARFKGLYADMLSPTFAIRENVSVPSGARAILYDLSKCDTNFEIIGTQARVLSIEEKQRTLCLKLSSPDGISTHVRLCCPKPVKITKAFSPDGESVPFLLEWDERSHTALFSYESDGKSVDVELHQE